MPVDRCRARRLLSSSATSTQSSVWCSRRSTKSRITWWSAASSPYRVEAAGMVPRTGASGVTGLPP
jgi:hypothetical protein